MTPWIKLRAGEQSAARPGGRAQRVEEEKKEKSVALRAVLRRECKRGGGSLTRDRHTPPNIAESSPGESNARDRRREFIRPSKPTLKVDL